MTTFVTRLSKVQTWKLLLAIAVFILCFSAVVFSAGLLTTPVTSSSPPPTPPAEPPPVTATPPQGTQTPTTTPPPQTTTTTQLDVDPAVTLSGTESLTIHSSTGELGALRGTLNGTLTWNNDAVDAVTVVVQSWVPGDGWAQTKRVQVNQTAPVILADVLESPVMYANHSRAAVFENPSDGTIKTRQGAISVTAVLFGNGEEQHRITDTMSYTVSVINIDQSNDDSAGNVALQLGIGNTDGPTDNNGDPPLVNASQIAPGARYASTATLSNPGSDSGTVYFNVSYQTFENAIVNEAESSVDATGGDPGRGNGELHHAVDLRIARVQTDGTRTYILGNTTTYRDLTAISQQPTPLTELSPDETTDLRVEYRIEPTAGNEIQSDTITLDFQFLIES